MRYTARVKPVTQILAFYAFSALEHGRLASLRAELFAFGQAHDMRGLVLLATEGINGTVCGSPEAIGEWRALITAQFQDVTWNESTAEAHVYPRWLVKVREEIVALKKPGSSRLNGTHLTPAEWNEKMSRPNTVVIDARNTYETAIGTFNGAIDPKITNFQQFTGFAAACDVPKDAEVLLYCTGGIRCEKAVAAMQESGYKNVFQLKGGILSYLKECPEGTFNGECFVFDHRVAVDKHLQPSTIYKLCPTCGDPGTEKRSCAHCEQDFTACVGCIQKRAAETCSKNCRYHQERSKALTGAGRPVSSR